MHGFPPDALQAVFQAVVVNKLIYAAPWYGFTTAADRGRQDSFCDVPLMSVTADEQLFGKIINNTQHLLYCLLPPQREWYSRV